MKILQIGLTMTLLLMTQSIFLAVDELCEPDRSIENQKAKQIPEKGQALLRKIVRDMKSFDIKNGETFLDWPVEVCKCWVSSLFGPRKSGHHNGVDLAAPRTTPVYASADGYVEIAQENSDVNSYGNMILLDHEDLTFYEDKITYHYKTRYAHLDTILVQEGQFVEKGDQIGTVGATGHVVAKHKKSDPSHLHFEVYRGVHRINPLIALFASDKVWVKSNL